MKIRNFVKEGQKLPLYGVGPYIVYGMVGLTIPRNNFFLLRAEDRIIRNAVDIFISYHRRYFNVVGSFHMVHRRPALWNGR